MNFVLQRGRKFNKNLKYLSCWYQIDKTYDKIVNFEMNLKYS